MPTYSEPQKLYLKQLGTRIRTIRQEQYISQEELAIRSGLDRTYVGSVERGERNISILNLKKVADALGVEVFQLIKEISNIR